MFSQIGNGRSFKVLSAHKRLCSFGKLVNARSKVPQTIGSFVLEGVYLCANGGHDIVAHPDNHVVSSIMFAKVGVELVAGDTVKPAAKLSVRVVAIQVLVCCDKGNLEEVIDGIWIGESRCEERPHPRAIFGYDGTIGISVAVFDLLDDVAHRHPMIVDFLVWRRDDDANL